MDMLDLLFKNATVVGSDRTAQLDVGIAGEKIAFLADPGVLEWEASRTVDASGLLLVPGGIDPHVHFNWAVGPLRAQSAASGSRAAAFGGTTTFIDFSYQHGDESILASVDQKRSALADEHPHIDYALHAMVTGDVPNRVLREIPELVGEGVTSLKMFTALPMSADDGCIWETMKIAGEVGATVMVHCEDNCIISRCSAALHEQGEAQARNIHRARPDLAEEAAISRMRVLARRTGTALYVVHVSSAAGARVIAEANEKGEHVGGEALHNALVFTDQDYARPDGVLYHNFPPLKTKSDRAALWSALADGGLHTVASDDFTVPRDVKLAGKTVDDIAGGHNGVETRMPVLFSEGVSKQRIDLHRFVELTSTAPAKRFGLYPKKGVIAPGSDADIVLIDPDRHHTIRLDELHSDCDYSIWDGFECIGVPTMTVSRGQILVEDGMWVGKGNSGRFLRCGLPGR